VSVEGLEILGGSERELRGALFLLLQDSFRELAWRGQCGWGLGLCTDIGTLNLVSGCVWC
jgi:hypothetical protein